MSKLTFTPTNYIGWGSLQHLLVEVQKFEAKNILIVTGPVVKRVRYSGPY
ncbi:Alcohol dehydrogenase OS=Lysinibacillus sphaericus OX=1421 GN=LS41612_09755 PE=3 SV=1 [Lysinibacillus sphaericus]